MKIHKTMVPAALNYWEGAKHTTVALVSLYRRSQAAEETGRLFVIKNYIPISNQVEVGLFRTDDNGVIAVFQTFYPNAIMELSDDQIMRLFKAA